MARNQLEPRGRLHWIRCRRRLPTLLSLSGRLILGFLLGISCAPCCTAYSVLTHEAIVDAAWKDSIDPLLLNRFSHAFPEDLFQAHAYAYGGAIIQDLGYYPSGGQLFSDLTHLC